MSFISQPEIVIELHFNSFRKKKTKLFILSTSTIWYALNVRRLRLCRKVTTIHLWHRFVYVKRQQFMAFSIRQKNEHLNLMKWIGYTRTTATYTYHLSIVHCFRRPNYNRNPRKLTKNEPIGNIVTIPQLDGSSSESKLIFLIVCWNYYESLSFAGKIKSDRWCYGNVFSQRWAPITLILESS